jgi:hypothetical protein
MDGVLIMLEHMASMSHEERQSLNGDPMKIITSGNVLERIVDKTLDNFVAGGIFSKEEIAMYKPDLVHIEEQAKVVFDQMKGTFPNPDKTKALVDVLMTTVQKLAPNSLLGYLQDLLTQKTTPSDLEIEEMRLKMIQNKDKPDDSIILAGTLIGTVEFAEIFSSGKGWKETVMERCAAMLATLSELLLALPLAGMAGMTAGVGAATGVGEL